MNPESDLKQKLDGLDSKLLTVDQRLQKLTETLSTLVNTIEKENKMNRIYNALDHVDIVEEFNVYDEDDDCFLSSKQLTKNILKSFARGNGYWVDEYMVAIDDDVDEGLSEEEYKKMFREKISDNILVLTGTKPTLRQEKGGRWCIWF